MKIATPITEMLGIELPIIGAPMFLISYSELVVAVSEAGGIGCFPSMNYRTIIELRDGIQEIRSRTKKPIGVNIILYKEHNPTWPRQLEVCLEEKVDLLITSMGTPRTVVREAKAVGSKIFCDVTTLRQALLTARAGADALIAVSQGAGGHAGGISPMSFIPYLKKETTLPIIAAGAISTGSQMAAAFALGADAVYIGTRLIATEEARAPADYKQLVIDAKPEDIVFSDSVSGIGANWLKKSLDNKPPVVEGNELESQYKQWRDIWSAGHGVAQIDAILPAAEIIKRIANEYLEAVRDLPGSEI